MNKSRIHTLAIGLSILLASVNVPVYAQEIEDPLNPAEATNSDESMPVEVVEPVEAESNTPPVNHRQPNTQAELEAAYESEALAIVNEQLRKEIELLARDFRDAERRNEIQLFGLGALVALVFLGVGFLIGKRFGGRRRL
ncbi:MAG: hypothetical protein J4G19_08120 [Pseudomonadales bacterium]|nr:hypothetical protein [Pseudomonadales bacterium]